MNKAEKDRQALLQRLAREQGGPRSRRIRRDQPAHAARSPTAAR